MMAYSREKEIRVQDKVSDHYEQERYARSYSKLYQRWWTLKMLSMIRQENLRGRILDNGCGIGSHFDELSMFSQKIVGLDLSGQMLCKAKARATIKRIVMADSQQLPFKSRSFDFVFSRSLLHHLPHPESCISEIQRILDRDGEAVFSDTNCSLVSDLPRKIAKKEKDGHFAQSHRNFNDKELINLISRHLKVERVYYFGYLAYPLLGFPDLVDVFSCFPFKNFFTFLFIKLDEALSLLPVLRTQSWGIIIKASKRKE